MNLLNTEQAPMVTVGVDFMRALYAKANNYNSLLEDGIQNHPEGLDRRSIHERALEVVKPYLRSHVEAATNQFEAANDRQIDSIEEIVKGARFGRVETLLLEKRQHVWGTFNEAENTVLKHAEGSTPDNQDLLNLAAIDTLAHGGKVFVLEPYDMPVSVAGAVTRY